MKTNPTLHYFPLTLSIFLTISYNQGTSQTTQYDPDNDETYFVMIQLKQQKNKDDSISSSNQVRDVFKHIKSINSKLGYTDFAKKTSSFKLEQSQGSTSYMVIRNFDDFRSAEVYTQAIDKELPDDIFGEIGDPFPISLRNYESCIAEKDFNPYYKYYFTNH
ncbi:MAG: hypothetical protein ABJB16_07345 [Saprospiraceae bacterium]